ncbi:MAG: formate--tetrahydrofolate ligase [Calditrichaeota bacterium]|nr:MAG: formate--tetrahydrofolate ligase [Calditrichota bacterium]
MKSNKTVPNRTSSQAPNSLRLLPITKVAAQLGLSPDDLILYGEYKAKIKWEAIRRVLEGGGQRGKLVLVSAITPTPAGEGKTTTAIGLAQGLRQVGVRASVALREPSMGPTLGRKGGATGGGRSQVHPAQEINLHFTGDIHAVTAAHNLIAASLDNHLHFMDLKGMSTRGVLWKRVMDMQDRTLRDIVIGLGGPKNGIPRQTGFDITAASEIMAILCLATSYAELKERIGQILLGFREDGEPFLARDLNIHGAAAALLREAFLPNLVQTSENGPAFVHGGPFANIAQGTNSVISTRLSLYLNEVTVVEAGFGFDLGAEKFFDIVCPYGHVAPGTVVLVATVRALKMHGGVPLDQIANPNPDAVFAGRGNLEKHIENIRKFGLQPIVAVNRFAHDREDELKAVLQICQEAGASCVIADPYGKGGEGMRELAHAVLEALRSAPDRCRPLYDWNLPVEQKIETVAREIYGAAAVDYLPRARKDLKRIYQHGFNRLPVCIAKTQQSLSDNPKLLGRPKDFLVTVREIIIASGAGFLVPLTGDILRMPGLPHKPLAESIDIDENGNIVGVDGALPR